MLDTATFTVYPRAQLDRTCTYASMQRAWPKKLHPNTEITRSNELGHDRATDHPKVVVARWLGPNPNGCLCGPHEGVNANEVADAGGGRKN